MLLRRIFSFARLLASGLVFVIIVSPEWPAFQDERYVIDTILGQQSFDFVSWEVNALLAKGEGALTGTHTYLDQVERKELVLRHLDELGQVRRLESEITAIHADPGEDDPGEASRELQQQVDDLRVKLELQQPAVEAIVQGQVATILVEEGFDLFGNAWPPVLMNMTPLPRVLIVSPRDEIRQVYNISLKHGLSELDREEIESAVYERVDLSALVVPIGGLGIYPAMILETSSINFLVDTVAHEWAHHWLSLHPLGLNYLADPALRTINETVASIVGDEVGARVIARYYPEFMPEEPEPVPQDLPDKTDEPPSFDFNAEMRETRLRVDEFLAQGLVDEAETYMEERRQFFWENGRQIRKLNQAYFAFYGAYADTPGEHGDDPIGPTLVAIRENSSSLRAFMDVMAPITSLADLEKTADSLLG